MKSDILNIIINIYYFKHFCFLTSEYPTYIYNQNNNKINNNYNNSNDKMMMMMILINYNVTVGEFC